MMADLTSLVVAAVVIVHAVSSILLAAFGLHRLAMAWQFRRVVRAAPTLPNSGVPRRWPTVTVQLPLFNERYVAERAVRAAGGLRYPDGKLQIQVLDDSTDETSRRVAEVVTELRASGIDVTHIRRPDRRGYKAGALANGLRHAAGELVAIFDADFVPDPDFLERIIPEFGDPGVGMVQARWGHLNGDTSLLTRAQTLQLDAHFTTEHGVRAALGYFFNFNGTAGVWRRAAIEESGGWEADTLTEDLDLSYRAQLQGWRFVYRDDIEVPAEVPAEMAAYRAQQQRWAQGGVQTARKILPRLLSMPLPAGIKRAAMWHLLIHFAYPLLVVVTLAGLAVGLLAEAGTFRWILAVDGLLLTFAMLSLFVFYGVTAHARAPANWVSRLVVVPAVMILGAGISVGQSLAIVRGLTRRHGVFARTPKYHLGGDASRTWHRRSYRLPLGGWTLVEAVAGTMLMAVAATYVLVYASPPSALLVLLGLGLMAVSGTSLFQRVRRYPSPD